MRCRICYKNTEGKLLEHDKKLDRIIESMGGLKAKVAIGSFTIAAVISYVISTLR